MARERFLETIQSLEQMASKMDRQPRAGAEPPVPMLQQIMQKRMQLKKKNPEVILKIEDELAVNKFKNDQINKTEVQIPVPSQQTEKPVITPSTAEMEAYYMRRKPSQTQSLGSLSLNLPPSGSTPEPQQRCQSEPIPIDGRLSRNSSVDGDNFNDDKEKRRQQILLNMRLNKGKPKPRTKYDPVIDPEKKNRQRENLRQVAQKIREEKVMEEAISGEYADRLEMSMNNVMRHFQENQKEELELLSVALDGMATMDTMATKTTKTTKDNKSKVKSSKKS